MNVVVLTAFIPGGLVTHTNALAKGLTALGHHVWTFGTGDGSTTTGMHVVTPSAETRAEPVKRAPNGRPLYELTASCQRDVATAVRAALASANVRPDVIVSSDMYFIHAALELRETFGAPIVHIVHQSWTKTEQAQRWLPAEVHAHERNAFDAAAAIVTVSRSARAEIIAQAPEHADKTRVIYNGIDAWDVPRLDERQQIELRRTLGIGDRRIVLFAGRSAPQKGIAELIEAAPQVAARVPGTCYVIVGDGSEALQQRHPGLVYAVGWRPREALGELYQIADLAVVPSRFEPFGYAALEAMLLGVPTIASNVGGLAEIIEDDRSGLLVPMDRAELPRIAVDDFIAAQVALLTDRERAARLGATGRDRARTFSNDAMARGYERLFASVATRSQ